MFKKTIITAAAFGILSTVPAAAHVTLETQEAAVGSYYKAVFRVPHGCQGEPTNVVRVQVPEGVIGVKPMPKPGWELEKVRSDYENTYTLHGSEISEGVTEVIWSGGNLLDDEYDEFVLRGYLTTALEAGEMLHFPTVQECPDGLVERWIEAPAPGQSAGDLEMPAPGLLLRDAGGNH